MAFSTAVTNKLNRVLPAAYVTCRVTFCDKKRTVLDLVVWESAEARKDFPTIPDCILAGYEFATELDLQAANPVDYGYQLLAASGEFPDATWTV